MSSALRTFLLLAITCAPVLGGCAAESGDESVATSDEDLSLNANDTLNNFLDAFWDGSRGEFKASTTSYWFNAQGFDAVLDGEARSQEKLFTHWPMKIFQGNERQYGGWLTPDYKKTYFDDITWMTIALLRAHDLAPASDKATYLDAAKSTFQDVIDRAQSHDKGRFDGLWWSSAHDFDEKATASNFGPVIAAVRLAQRTGHASYVTFAKMVYDHWFAAMVEREPDGSLFVYDNIQGTKKSAPRFTYNAGLAIGAAIAMSHASTTPADKAKYLAEAYGFGKYLTAHETTAGHVLVDFDADDKTPAACHGDCAAFKGIAYRYLAELYGLDTTHTDLYVVLDASAKAIVHNALDPKTHRFGSRWDNTERADLENLGGNASAVMALNLYAELPKPK